MDKFRRTEPLNINFTAGEQPQPAKLNAMVQQSRSGSRILETAIGDPWNQSGDSILTGHSLKLPNLARIIGKNDILSPIVHGLPYSTTDKSIYYFDTVYKYTGYNEGFLTFPPKSGTTFTIEGTTTGFTNEVATEDLVVASGDFWIDSATGRFKVYRTIDATNTDTVIKYLIDPSTWPIDNTILPSVVPDVRQSYYTGCRISTDGTKYYLHLPPRAPLTLLSNPSRYPAVVDYSNNSQGDYSDTSLTTLWQDPSLYFVQDAHYRYTLPKEIIDVWDSLAPGASLPKGFLCLWDINANTLIEDVTFAKPSDYQRPTSYADPTLVNATDEWVVEIISPSYSLASKVTEWQEIDGGAHLIEDATNYATGLYLITPGASVASQIAMLWKLYLEHEHDNSSDMSTPLNFNPLINAQTAFYTGAPISSSSVVTSLNLMPGTYLLSAQAHLNPTSTDTKSILQIMAHSSTVYATSEIRQVLSIWEAYYMTLTISPVVVTLNTSTTIDLYFTLSSGTTSVLGTDTSSSKGTYLTAVKIG